MIGGDNMSYLIEIKNSYLTVGINSYGAELYYVNSVNGTEFLWCGDEKIWSGRAPLLFPICGGLKNDTYTYQGNTYKLNKHGFGKVSEFKGNKISDTKAEFILESNSDTLKCYPFEFVLKITYELKNNKLVVTYNVENKTDGPMYYSIGSHEAYSCPEGIEEYSVIFDEPVEIDSYQIGECGLLYDTVRIMDKGTELKLKKSFFAIDGIIFKDVNFDKVHLVHRNSNKKITAEFKGCDYFLIWTKPEGNYICLEPWQGIADFVDEDGDISRKQGIRTLGKGEISTTSHSITFEE